MAIGRAADRLSEEQLRANNDQDYVDEYDPHADQRTRRMLQLFGRTGLELVEANVAVRDAESHRALLEACGFANVHVRYLAHYLKLASKFHGLGALPLIGRYFRARLFLVCRKSRSVTHEL